MGKIKGKTIRDVLVWYGIESGDILEAEKEVKQLIANELRKIPQVDESLELYLWKRIDELEANP